MSDVRSDKYIWISAIIGMALICAGVAIRTVMYVAAVAAVAIVIFAPKTVVILLLFSWLSFSTVFKFSVGATSIFTYLELLFAIRLIVQNHKMHAGFFFSWCLYAAYLLFGMGSEYTTFLKVALMPLLFYLMARETDYSDLSKIIKFYVLGVVVSSFVGYFKSYIPNMSTFVNDKAVNLAYTGTGFISSARITGLWGDPNYYSIHLILAIMLVAVLYSRKELSIVPFYSVYIICTLFGALTGSKSFILMLVIATFLIIVQLWGKHNFKQLLLFVLVMVAGLFLIISGYIDAFSMIMSRLSSVDFSSTSSITTDRTLKWAEYINEFNRNFGKLLVGNGIGKGFSFAVPHNSYLDYLDLLGLIGTGVFLVCMVQAAKCGWKIQRERGRIGNVSPLLILLGMYAFLSMFYSIDLLFELFAAIGIFVLMPIKETSSAPINIAEV